MTKMDVYSSDQRVRVTVSSSISSNGGSDYEQKKNTHES